MTSIIKWLENSEPISPLPTKHKADLKKMDGVKALIFDIYGTLLISSSGDIDQATISSGHLKTAFESANYKLIQKEKELEKSLQNLLGHFVGIIKHHHQRHINSGRKFPEVDIRLVWEDFVNLAIEKQIITKTEKSDPDRLTFVFELLSNKVYPMPGMKKIVKHFKKAGYPLGIISNAQFYTPIVLNYFLNGKIDEREVIADFDPELTVFSYHLYKAKPDNSLFDQLLAALKNKHGIQPKEAAFIGNDMYKDIYPAHECGMKTVLFAGDERSLRLRPDRKEIENLKPDATITELKQLKEIFVK